MLTWLICALLGHRLDDKIHPVQTKNNDGMVVTVGGTRECLQCKKFIFVIRL